LLTNKKEDNMKRMLEEISAKINQMMALSDEVLKASQEALEQARIVQNQAKELVKQVETTNRAEAKPFRPHYLNGAEVRRYE
jgi:ABC-type transporter Mla subunit MlaD